MFWTIASKVVVKGCGLSLFMSFCFVLISFLGWHLLFTGLFIGLSFFGFIGLSFFLCSLPVLFVIFVLLFLFLATQDAQEVMYVIQSVSGSRTDRDFTDVTLVSDDTFWRLYWCFLGYCHALAIYHWPLMGHIMSTGIGFFLFKWTFDCSLFWVWRRHSLTVRIFSQKSITKW